MSPIFLPTGPPDDHPDAVRTYRVKDAGHIIGTVALEIAARPAGTSPRRDWWAITPDDDDWTYTRPTPTRTAAAQHLQHRWRVRHQPPAPVPRDRTLEAIITTREQAGPAAAAFLAAALAAHHFRELYEARHANPPSLWREILRATTWLTAPTAHEHP